MNNEIQIKGNTNFMGIEVPNLEGGFGENQKVILAKTVAEVHNEELRRVNEIINRNRDEFEDGIDIIDLKNSIANCDSLLENLGYTKQKISNSKNIYLLSEQGYMLLVGFMKTKEAKEIRKKLRREYFSMRKVIKDNEDLKKNLLLDVYGGGTKAIESAKRIAKIEIEEKTKEIKDGNDKVLTCGQVVNQLEISELTTTILNEWFCLNGFGTMMKKQGEKKRCFQPSEKFLQLIAKEGYSMTGKTQKGDKIKVVYTVGLVKELIDNYLDSIKSYTEIQIGKKIA
ncbi:ORF6N domain-containing protein [Clostridium sardiniense]|uniref:ORF6N domain-containing protein n=1 Tax=Clostridium sardiniense TaxID=29369 RepID=UPI001959F7F1|nr:ORF6N domain-containing protein [Clostridium sardiniense]MBM7835758.1 hypothetical protein [Clostridium sardiniense]